MTDTLTFSQLQEQGEVINHLDLSADPLGPDNDSIEVIGALTVSGLNTIEVAGTLRATSVYPLIHYGSLSGDLSNFQLLGSTGSLSKNVSTKTIYLITQSGIRAPTSITWVGNATANDWLRYQHHLFQPS